MNINKPQHFPKYDLIAIKGIRDLPLEPQDINNRTFELSEIAVNESAQKVQVYVVAKTKKGLEDFKRLYPTAEIQEDGSLEKPENWRIICFVRQTKVEENPIDSFFRGHHKDYRLKLEREVIKQRGKRNND